MMTKEETITAIRRDEMNDETRNYILLLLDDLKPTTLAAIAADVEEQSWLKDFYELVLLLGMFNCGEQEFAELIAEAANA